MEDYSGLKAAIPAAPISGRVWGVPKKRRSEERSPSDGKQQGESSNRDENDREAEEPDLQERAEPEEFRYGAHGLRRRKNHQVDVII
jgi:hypothetical protein